MIDVSLEYSAMNPESNVFLRTLNTSPLSNKTAEEMGEIHSQRVRETSHNARLQILDGKFKDLSLKEAFNNIWEIHAGNTIEDLAQSIYDAPDQGNIGDGKGVSNVAYRMFKQFYKFINTENEEPPNTNITYEEVRQTDLLSHLMAGGTAFIGYPLSRIGEERSTEFFTDFLDEFFELLDDQVTLTINSSDQNKYALSLYAATILDFLHMKPDLNGRSTEDWMIEIQLRLFDGDTSKVQVWSPNDNRAVNSNYKDSDREKIMKERGSLIKKFSQNILRRALNIEGELSVSESEWNNSIDFIRLQLEHFARNLIDLDSDLNSGFKSDFLKCFLENSKPLEKIYLVKQY